MKLNKQLYVLLLCFLIAFVFWLLLALSSQYQSTVNIPVAYKNLPPKQVVVNELPSQVAVQLRTSGFRILSYHLQNSMDTVEVDVSAGLSNSASIPGAIVVPTRYFLQDFTRQLGEEVLVMGFRPDSVVLLFNERVSRKLPVRLDVSLTLARQFDTINPPKSIPDSILVSGPPFVIDSLLDIRTEKISFDRLRQSVLQPARLLIPSMVSASYSEVKVSIPVEEFTEGKLDVPVKITGIPAGYSLKIFPEKAQVRYQVPLSRFNEISASQFEVSVDASGLPSAAITVLPLRMLRTSSQARNFILDPSEVEFILRKK